MIREDLILVVKVTNHFRLSPNESRHYPFGKRNSKNLKSRTLGDWLVPEDKLDQINYIIGVNPSGEQRIVSAYKVDKGKTELGFDRKKRRKYAFYSDTNSEEVLKELGLFNYRLPTLKFGFNSELLYLKRFSYLNKSLYFLED